MSALRYEAGQIVLADWRDALPKEPNKRRPAVVVEDSDLFDPSYPNLILVPLASGHEGVIRRLSVEILPTPENGCTGPCRALAHNVTTTSKHRVTRTPSRITQAQLAQIRRLIGAAIGLG